MKRNLLASAIACLLISSCANPPASGPLGAADQATDNVRGASDGRLSGMASAALEREQTRAQAPAPERSGLMQKMDEINTELAEIRNRIKADNALSNEVAAPHGNPVEIAVAAAGAGNLTAARQQAMSRSGKNTPASSKVAARTPPLSATSRVSRETIVIQDKGMIFRVMHNFARTDFHPSASLQQQLLQAARAGKRIDIRGRTDASAPNDVDRNIAMQRALNARVFLANNGIHPRKMHIDYLAAGDNVADNSTADGRARNRRVEIETVGMNADVLEDLASLIRQDLQ